MDFSSSSVTVNSQSTGLLNWNFSNLNPFETREITVTFALNTPTQTPPLNGGAVLNYTTQINGATDETPLDNTFTLNQTVVNSFDRMIKRVWKELPLHRQKWATMFIM
jgi:hypothetical protein